MRDNPELIAIIYLAFFISVILMLLMLIYGIRLMVKALSLPREILFPIIVMLCVIGCYALNSSMFDVWVFFGMGILGTVMAALNFPLLPLVLGLMLGRMAGKPAAHQHHAGPRDARGLPGQPHRPVLYRHLHPVRCLFALQHAQEGREVTGKGLFSKRF